MVSVRVPCCPICLSTRVSEECYVEHGRPARQLFGTLRSPVASTRPTRYVHSSSDTPLFQQLFVKSRSATRTPQWTGDSRPCFRSWFSQRSRWASGSRANSGRRSLPNRRRGVLNRLDRSPVLLPDESAPRGMNELPPEKTVDVVMLRGAMLTGLRQLAWFGINP